MIKIPRLLHFQCFLRHHTSSGMTDGSILSHFKMQDRMFRNWISKNLKVNIFSLLSFLQLVSDSMGSASYTCFRLSSFFSYHCLHWLTDRQTDRQLQSKEWKHTYRHHTKTFIRETFTFHLICQFSTTAWLYMVSSIYWLPLLHPQLWRNYLRRSSSTFGNSQMSDCLYLLSYPNALNHYSFDYK